MPLRAANWIVSRRLQATHSGGWGRWSGLGTTLRGGMLHELAVPAGERLLDEHARDRVDRVLPHLALARAVHQEAAQLRGRGRLAGAEVHAGRRETRSSVATRSATRAGWFTAGGICTMPWPSRMCCVRAAGGRQEHLGRRGVASTPRGSGARPPRRSRSRRGRPSRPASSASLSSCVLDALALPRTRVLVLVEDSEAHLGGWHSLQAIWRPGLTDALQEHGARTGQSSAARERARPQPGRRARPLLARGAAGRGAARTTSRRCSSWPPRRRARRSTPARSR